MTVASLVISILAMCGVVGNFTWQLSLYLLNGPRIQVRMAVGALGRGGLVTMPVEDVKNLTEAFASFEQQGYTQRILAVHVVNQGRLGVELLDFGIDVPRGVSFKPVRDAITETPMPYVLEPHREGTWAMPFDYVVSLVEASQSTWPNEAHPISAYVRRAGGKKIHAKQKLRMTIQAPGAPWAGSR
ncbi:hypothetical protein [Streptomyces anthocyanicus]|uniref:hypothetical protein n=1 Tax=Streptomyces anthocyanicus TaxID=68174 RepID=UPI00386F85ED|nr:hypothetical protein OH747_25985 [Streptomyces anthocyanicus]